MSELISNIDMRQHRKKESIEIPLSRRAWLGGVFEAGGGIYCSIYKRNNTVIPHVEMSDSDPKVPERLYREFGGSFKPRLPNSFLWIISGHEASRIAMSMNLFAPSRREVIDLIGKLEQNRNPRERVAMVREFREKEASDFETEDYSRLLEIPEFVAGVIDARGAVYSSFPTVNHQSQLRLHTSNESLIDALIKKFGGEKTLHSSKGSIVSIDKRYTAKRDGLYWSLGMGKTALLYRFVSQHLLGGRIKGYKAYYST